MQVLDFPSTDPDRADLRFFLINSLYHLTPNPSGATQNHPLVALSKKTRHHPRTFWTQRKGSPEPTHLLPYTQSDQWLTEIRIFYSDWLSHHLPFENLELPGIEPGSRARQIRGSTARLTIRLPRMRPRSPLKLQRRSSSQIQKVAGQIVIL